EMAITGAGRQAFSHQARIRLPAAAWCSRRRILLRRSGRLVGLWLRSRFPGTRLGFGGSLIVHNDLLGRAAIGGGSRLGLGAQLGLQAGDLGVFLRGNSLESVGEGAPQVVETAHILRQGAVFLLVAEGTGGLCQRRDYVVEC